LDSLGQTTFQPAADGFLESKEAVNKKTFTSAASFLWNQSVNPPVKERSGEKQRSSLES
jgi:hypothetical protein